MASKTEISPTTDTVSTTDEEQEIKNIYTKDADAAWQFIRNAEVSDVVVNEQKLVRKLDWMLMPLMFMCYYLQYSDKTLLSYAAVMGVIEDTNMPSNGFSNLAMAFYASFLVCEPIQSFLLQKFPTAKFLGGMVVIWGIVLTMNCVCHNFASIVALRVLLGIFESVTAPALVIMTSRFYKRKEQVVRMGLWYQGTSIGPIVSSLVSYGFLHYYYDHPNSSFKSWQIVFLLYGLVTIAIGVLVILFLPDNPMNSRLSDTEKLAVIERLRENQTGIQNKHIKWPHVKEALLDIKTWLLALIVIATNIPNGAVSSYSSIILSNFGYSDGASLLLNIPGSVVAFISVWLSCWFASSDKGRRGLSAILLIIPTIIGGALMAWLPQDKKAGLLAGNFLTNTVGSTMPLFYSWSAGNNGGNTKKSTMNAVVLMSFCVGNMIGPETFRDADAPQYIPAKITIVGVLLVAIVLIVVLDAMLWFENRKRDREDAHEMPPDYEFLDLTDKENRNFRYLL